jgi:hypothetical protein
MKGWLQKLLDYGFITVSQQSIGLHPNSYALTEDVCTDSVLLDDIQRLGEALYGTEGLLTDWQYPATYGHGCLNTSGTLLLAALVRINSQIAIDDLLTFLAPLVQRRTAKRALTRLQNSDVAVIREAHISLHDDWDVNLESFLFDNPAGTPRFTKGNQARQRDWSAILTYMTAGQVTELEMIELRKLPCVFCGGPSNEQEHFPPQRFFRAHRLEPEIVNIFPTCRKCNSERLGFIRSLPITRFVPFAEYFFAMDSDQEKIRASGIEHQRQQFEKAFQARDKEAALTAINTALSLSMTAGKLRLAGSSKQVVKKRATLVDSIGIEKPLT